MNRSASTANRAPSTGSVDEHAGGRFHHHARAHGLGEQEPLAVVAGAVRGVAGVGAQVTAPPESRLSRLDAGEQPCGEVVLPPHLVVRGKTAHAADAERLRAGGDG
ncbi:MAG TPA: hypothetical protein VGD11_18155 [Mycobacteriales bacterium]